MKKYQIILTDPPWSYSDKAHSGDRGAGYKYSTMSVDEICALPVRRIADDNCALFMWVTMPQIPVALKVIKRWQFEYVTTAFTWIKKTKNDRLFWGMGNMSRANAELVLYARRGKPKRVAANVHSVVEAQIREHSRKPDEVRDRIVQLMGDLPRLEMFARPPACEGWDVWGDQIECDVDLSPDKSDRLKLLAKLAQKRTQVR